MSGLKTTTLTLEQMRSRRAQGESKSDWARLKYEVEADVEPTDDPRLPCLPAEPKKITLSAHIVS